MLLLVDGAFIRSFVFLPILFLDVLLAVIALVSFVAALVNVVHPDLDSESLLAELALFGSQLASVFMVPESGCRGCVWAVLTLDRFVGCLFVLFPISLRYDIATLSTLVVVPGTANFVHPDFAHADFAFASRADFRFFLSYLRHLYFR